MTRKLPKGGDDTLAFRTAVALTDHRPRKLTATTEPREIYVLGAGKDLERPNTGAWAVSQDLSIAPLVFVESMDVAGPTEAEFRKFWKLAGRSEEYVSHMIGLDDERHDFQFAIHDFVLMAAIPGLKQQWRELDQHLQRLIKAGEKFLLLAAPSLTLDRGVLLVPPAISVCASILSKPGEAADFKAAIGALRRTLQHYREERSRLKLIVTKRGQKGDQTLTHLAEALIPLAGDNLALPANESLTKGRSEHPTPLLKLMRAVLDVAVREGLSAVRKSALSNADKESAVKNLAELKKKTDGALIEHLRAAKRSWAAGHGVN